MLDKIALSLVLTGLIAWVVLVLIAAITLFTVLVTGKEIELSNKSKRYLGATLVFGVILVFVGYIIHGVDLFLPAYPSAPF